MSGGPRGPNFGMLGTIISQSARLQALPSQIATQAAAQAMARAMAQAGMQNTYTNLASHAALPLQALTQQTSMQTIAASEIAEQTLPRLSWRIRFLLRFSRFCVWLGDTRASFTANEINALASET